MSLTTSRDSRRASRLEDSEIHVLTVDDVPGWMLMRKASLTQERRERLTAALPSEHFGINDVKRCGEIFPEVHINEHRESDGHSRRLRNVRPGFSSSVSETRRHIAPTSMPQCSRDCHEWADTESVDDETERILRTSRVLRKVNWRRCHLELTIFQRSVECFFHSRRVLKIGDCGDGTVSSPWSIVHESVPPETK